MSLTRIILVLVLALTLWVFASLLAHAELRRVPPPGLPADIPGIAVCDAGQAMALPHSCREAD